MFLPQRNYGMYFRFFGNNGNTECALRRDEAVDYVNRSGNGTSNSFEILQLWVQLLRQRTTNTLIRLCGPVILLFAYGINRFSHDVADLINFATRTVNPNYALKAFSNNKLKIVERKKIMFYFSIQITWPFREAAFRSGSKV